MHTKMTFQELLLEYFAADELGKALVDAVQTLRGRGELLPIQAVANAMLVHAISAEMDGPVTSELMEAADVEPLGKRNAQPGLAGEFLIAMRETPLVYSLKPEIDHTSFKDALECYIDNSPYLAIVFDVIVGEFGEYNAGADYSETVDVPTDSCPLYPRSPHPSHFWNDLLVALVGPVAPRLASGVAFQTFARNLLPASDNRAARSRDQRRFEKRLRDLTGIAGLLDEAGVKPIEDLSRYTWASIALNDLRKRVFEAIITSTRRMVAFVAEGRGSCLLVSSTLQEFARKQLAPAQTMKALGLAVAAGNELQAFREQVFGEGTEADILKGAFGAALFLTPSKLGWDNEAVAESIVTPFQSRLFSLINEGQVNEVQAVFLELEAVAPNTLPSWQLEDNGLMSPQFLAFRNCGLKCGPLFAFALGYLERDYLMEWLSDFNAEEISALKETWSRERALYRSAAEAFQSADNADHLKVALGSIVTELASVDDNAIFEEAIALSKKAKRKQGRQELKREFAAALSLCQSIVGQSYRYVLRRHPAEPIIIATIVSVCEDHVLRRDLPLGRQSEKSDVLKLPGFVLVKLEREGRTPLVSRFTPLTIARGIEDGEWTKV